jgi:hypothetical protein
MDIFFCSACATPRGIPGACSERCATALAAVTPLHPKRSGSKVIVPINGCVGNVFKRICAATGNDHTKWKNYQGDLVLPAALVDGVGAHIVLQHIGANGDDERVAQELALKILSDKNKTKEIIGSITPEMFAHVLRHLPPDAVFGIGQSGVLSADDMMRRYKLDQIVYHQIEATIKRAKILLQKEKDAEVRRAAAHKAKRLELIGNRLRNLQIPEHKLPSYSQLELSETQNLFGKLYDPSVKEKPYDSTTFTPMESLIHTTLTFLLTHKRDDDGPWRARLFSVMDSLSEDEKRTTYDAISQLPEIKEAQAEASKEASKVLDTALTRGEKIDAARKVFRKNVYISKESALSATTEQIPFLMTPKALYDESNGVTIKPIQASLEGPRDVQIFYSPLTDKTITLIGEVHMQENTYAGYVKMPKDRMCQPDGNQIIELVNYMRALIPSTSDTIDLFFEVHENIMCWFNRSERICYASELVQVTKKLISDNPRALRFHATDIRFKTKFYDYFDHLAMWREGQELQPPPLPHYKLPMTPFEDESLSDFQETMYKAHDYARDYVNTKFMDMAAKAGRSHGYESDKSRAAHHYVYFMMLIDLYTLASLFRKDLGKNIIFYSGAQHTYNMAVHLTALGCIPILTAKGDRWHCLRVHSPYVDSFFLAPLQPVSVNKGMDELVAYLLRPSKYTRFNAFAPRFALVGVFAGECSRYDDPALKVLACYNQFYFRFYFTYVRNPTAKTFALLIRSSLYEAHAFGADKTVLAMYDYEANYVAQWSPSALAALDQLLNVIKVEQLNVKPQISEADVLQRSALSERSALYEREEYFYQYVRDDILAHKKRLFVEKENELPRLEEKKKLRIAELLKVYSPRVMLGLLNPELAGEMAALDETIRKLEAEKYESYKITLTPRETDVAALCAFIMSHPKNHREFSYLLTVLEKFTVDEWRTMYSAVSMTPQIKGARLKAVQAASLLLNKEGVAVSDKIKGAAIVFSSSQFLSRPKPLYDVKYPQKMPAIDVNIEGPFMIEVFYSPEHDRTIVLLGEHHMMHYEGPNVLAGYKKLPPERMCTADGNQTVGIANYIEAVFAQLPDTVDVFVEVDPHLLTPHPLENPLNYARELQLTLVKRAAKEPKQNPKMRFHWTDVRRIIEPVLYEKELLRSHHGLVKSDLRWELPRSLSEMRMRVLDKQVKATSPFVAHYIKRKFEDLVRVVIPEDPKAKASVYFNFFSSLVDLYTLGRMFKPYIGRNVICYNGALHTVPLAKYLEELGCVRMMQTKSDVWHCLQLRKPYVDNFFFAPLRDMQVGRETELYIIALLMRPSKYINTNDFAPRYALMGLLCSALLRFPDIEVAVLATYAQSSFDVFFTTANYHGETSFSIFIRSTKFTEHARIPTDNTLIAVYMYDGVLSHLSSREMLLLKEVLRHFKYEKDTSALQIK